MSTLVAVQVRVLLNNFLHVTACKHGDYFSCAMSVMSANEIFVYHAVMGVFGPFLNIKAYLLSVRVDWRSSFCVKLNVLS